MTLDNFNTSSERLLYIHTGTHKTGSTALQMYLADNRQKLAEVGISYVFPVPTDPSTGNGFHLFELFNVRKLNAQELDTLLESYFSNNSVAICSSEDFTRFGNQEWEQIKETCQRLKVQARFITFVRNIVPYYFSLYGQHVKAGEISYSFEKFVERDKYFPVMNSLKCLLELFGRESMNVIHYESAVESMDSEFMSAIGQSPNEYDRTSLQGTVNRSLTEYEQEILSRVNQIGSETYSLELSILLMSRRPYLKPKKQFDQNLIAILKSRHSPDIEWINQTFFNGNETVSIGGGADKKSYGVELSVEDKIGINQDVTNWCISKLQSIQSKSDRQLMERIEAIDWHNATDPAIPASFDPVAYLLLNLDLLRAGVPPYKHFINHGRYEKGRKWKWPSR